MGVLERWFMVENTFCSCREPSFSSQHPHSNAGTPVTPVPRDLVLISVKYGHQAHKFYAHIQSGKTLVHIKIKTEVLFFLLFKG